MRFRTALILGALAVVGLFVMTAGSALSQSATQTYIVQMLDEPAVAYDGGVAGIPATKPGKGKKIDPAAESVQRYRAHLKGKHDKALQNVGGGAVVYDYGISFNGFAAKLTEAQAEAMRFQKGVVAVTPDQLVTVDTSHTPTFLGLTARGGLWDQLGGVSKGGLNKGAGEDIIIGVVDSGIWPESRSFSDRKLDGSNGNNYPHKVTGWHGTCQSGENFTTANCNNKLIGAQRFNAAWGGDAGVEALRPWEFTSPRDYNGHGTHTASTAGGNFGVQPTGAAALFGEISGMAPRARIAAYKALWSTQDAATASGFTSDLAAAIDKAVADGVDVINYSVSGATTNFLDPVQVSFLFAADAGIFVSASAGNSGPTVGTVAHPSPWLTTVAAGTHNRDGQGSVTLGNGSTFNGASLATPVGPAPLVNSLAIAMPGETTDASLCFSRATNGGAPALNPALAAGKIVVCIRGTNARTDKSLAVQEAGGIGMILINPSANSLNADFHFVPTVHLQDTALSAVQTYAASPGATARINAATIVTNAPAPFTAAFSSRGPSPAANGDILKPDVIAPGQDILAAVAPPGNAGRDFNLLSGTSMSAPHVAGLAALLKQKFPSWSPMAVKSALMTSGGDILDGPNTNPLVIFRQGAGHVRPNNAANPGLVFDHGFNDWLAFICGAMPGSLSATTCNGLVGLGYSLDPTNLNSASIALGGMAGVKTVTRKVTNVSGQAESYTASVSGLTGINAVVSPIGSVGAGATKSFTVSFTQVSAALNAYTGGQLTLTGDKGHVVRIPIVIRPVALSAPREVSSNGSPINYDVTFGYTGPFSATARGLVPADITSGTVADDPTDGACNLTPGPDKVQVPVVIPAGTTYARFSLFDADVAPGADIDLCVFQGTTPVGSSGTGTSAEEVNFTFTAPTGGPIALTVVVHGWGVPGSSPFKLHKWYLGTANAGNMMVTAPASASIGTTGTINLTFSGLTPGTKYLGSVAYSGATGMPNPTIVRVNP
jgi:subtilisin family serine protease